MRSSNFECDPIAIEARVSQALRSLPLLQFLTTTFEGGVRVRNLLENSKIQLEYQEQSFKALSI